MDYSLMENIDSINNNQIKKNKKKNKKNKNKKNKNKNKLNIWKIIMFSTISLLVILKAIRKIGNFFNRLKYKAITNKIRKSTPYINNLDQ